MIYKQCILTIENNTATLDEDIYLYRLDKNVELYFTIVNNKYKFDKSDLNNIISMTKASYFQMRLYKNTEVKYTFTIQPTDDGKAILTITDDLIDEPIEVGDYDFQISLLDADKSSMISMPIARQQLHVCEPLVADASKTGTAILGLSQLDTTGEIVDAFDENGNYIRKVHVNGEIISAELFNKWETALETNTKNLAQVSSQYKDIAKQVENVGQPTQEQINIAINKAIEDGKITGTSGINANAKTLLQTILQNAVYITNQSSNITALISALSNTESGGGDTPTIKTYTITNKLTKCSNSNTNTNVNENTNYVATITPTNGYTLTGASVNVTMGGADITSTSYKNGTINIPKVTGNVVITINAKKIEVTVHEITPSYLSVKDYKTININNADTMLTEMPNTISFIAKDVQDYWSSGSKLTLTVRDKGYTQTPTLIPHTSQTLNVNNVTYAVLTIAKSDFTTAYNTYKGYINDGKIAYNSNIIFGDSPGRFNQALLPKIVDNTVDKNVISSLTW